MKKRLLALAAAVVIALYGIIGAGASVYTSKEPANGDCIYVAGNPDMYPIEYYDSGDKEFKGILPDLYEQISEESGIDFSYVSAGPLNEQSRLAKNKQVEIVSAHIKGDVEGLTDELHILTVDRKGEAADICIGFTGIASEELKKTVSGGLEAASSESLARLAVENVSVNGHSDYSFWLIFVTAGVFVLIVFLCINIVKRYAAERRALENKLVDPLTGIGNSLYFENRYQSLIYPECGTLYYIAYIGIDVRYIVQYCDAAVSEEIQMYAASGLLEETADNDFCARLSDGRFALAFEAPTAEFAKEKLGNFLDRLNRFDSSVAVGAHAGLYHLQSPGISCKQAVFNARQGYYLACESGELYVVSDPKILRHEEYILGLKRKIRRAIEKKEFRLYTQYIFSGSGKSACGAEALSRWESPDDGTIYPRQYIEMLETTGMIGELDLYILEECCRTLSEWRTDSKKNLWISCNVTKVTLSDEGFEERFATILGKYEFDRSKLVLEVSENVLAENSEQVARSIVQCKKAGCRIALDDYGLGHSSFKSLIDYPIDIVKISREIVKSSAAGRGEPLLAGVIALAHSLGIEALCEGVESKTELENSVAAGCDYIQGFLLARTIPVGEVSADRDVTFAGQ